MAAPVQAFLVLLLAVAPRTSCSKSYPYQPRAYTTHVDPQFIAETGDKISAFRSSLDLIEPPWSDGPPNSSIQTIGEYWTTEYDWFKDQAEINEKFSHCMTTVSPSGSYEYDLNIHFIHQRSIRDDALPILMLHGWPSTSLEWEKNYTGPRGTT